MVFNESPREDEALLTYLGEVSGTSLASPLGIAIDDSDRVYVSDVRLNTVKVFGPDLKYLHSLGDKTTFERPAGLSYNRATGEIIVIDSGTHDLKFFDRDGNLLRTVGGRGSEEGYFNFPTNVACDSEGRIYVVDTMNFRVQIFDPMGEYVSSFGQADNVPGSFSRPRGIALDSDGNVYVSDGAFSNIQIFRSNGVCSSFSAQSAALPGNSVCPPVFGLTGKIDCTSRTSTTSGFRYFSTSDSRNSCIY